MFPRYFDDCFCGKVYIRQTSRCVNDRLREHDLSMKNGTGSHLPHHCRECGKGCLPRLTETIIIGKSRDTVAQELREAYFIQKKKQRRLYQWSIAIPVFEGVPDPRQHAIKRCDCCLQLWLFCFYSIFFRSIILCVCLCVCRQATYIAVFPWNKSVVSSASVSSFFVFSVLVCSARFSLSNEPTSPTAYFTKKADPDLQRYLPVRFRKGAFVIADASAITSLSLKGTNRTRAAIDHYFYHTLCANSFVNINPVFFALLPIGKRIIKRI